MLQKNLYEKAMATYSDSSSSNEVISSDDHSLPDHFSNQQLASESPGVAVVEVSEPKPQAITTTHDITIEEPAVTTSEKTIEKISEDVVAELAKETAISETKNVPVLVKTDQTVEPDWKQQYDLLIELKRVIHTANVPNDGTYLYKWTQAQNIQYTNFLNVVEGKKSNRKTSMNETKIQMLREVGFVFERTESVGVKKFDKWEARADLLRKYRDRHGHTIVPSSDKNLDEDEKVEFKGLGHWVCDMRSKMRAYGTPVADPILTPARMQRLLDIGLSAESPRTNRKRKLQVEDIARKHSEKDSEKEQRKMRRRDEKWDVMYKEMKKFSMEYGHTVVPSKPEFQALRAWLVDQRREYKKMHAGEPSLLCGLKFQRLSEIGFAFEARKMWTFEERLQQWIEWRQKYGKDPTKRGESNGLKKWISQMRQKYKDRNNGVRTNLSQEQVDKLNKLGFIWCAIKNPENRKGSKPWAERFEELKNYIKENGHTLVPQATPGLGSWVKKQRTHYKTFLQGKCTSMTQEKIDRLNEIDFTWEVRDKTSTPGRAKKAADVHSVEEDSLDDDGQRSYQKAPIQYAEQLFPRPSQQQAINASN